MHRKEKKWKKIEFKNNSQPYLSAENLNKMQENAEIAINGVVESGSNENGNGTSLDFDYNCWYQDRLTSLPQKEGTNSIVADPLFLNNDLTIDGDYTLQETSSCVNKGYYDATYCGTLDIRGKNRVKGVVDMGCYEK